ncbi:SNF1-interacting protein, partial [Massospora cicadina]
KIRPEQMRPSRLGLNRATYGNTGRFLSLRPSRRNRSNNSTEYGEYLMAMQSMGVDLEELMMMEAIRESLREAEERERAQSETTAEPADTLQLPEDAAVHPVVASPLLLPSGGREISVTSAPNNLPETSGESCSRPLVKVSHDAANCSDATPTCEI